MATTTIDDITTARFVADAVGKRILAMARNKTSIIKNVNRDYQPEFSAQFNRVVVPVVGALTADDVVDGQAPTYQKATLSNVEITLDYFKEVPFSITSLAMLQSRPALFEQLVDNAAAELLRQMEADATTAIYPEFANTLDATGDGLTVGVLHRAANLLDRAGCPDEDNSLGRRIAIVHTDAYHQIAQFDAFARADYNRDNAAVNQAARLGRYATFNYDWSSQIPEVEGVHKNLLYHTSAVAMATRPLEFDAAPGMIVQTYSEDGFGFTVLMAGDIDLPGWKIRVMSLYGFKVLRPAWGIVLDTTPLE